MWLVTWAVIVIVNVFLYIWYLDRKRKYRDIEKIPGPPTKFLVGNTLDYGDTISDSFYFCQRMIKIYGSLVKIWQGPFRLNLFVTDPDHVEYFLSSNVHIKKSASYLYFRPWIGLGLVTNTGDIWRKHRKILTPAFHFKILEQFADTFHAGGKILVRKLTEQVGNPVEIHSYITAYALDVICESSMRIEANIQENSDKSFLNASRGFLDIFFKRVFSVVSRSDFLFRFYSDYADHKKYLDVLHSYTRKVIQQRRQEREEDSREVRDEFGIKKKKVFLDILLDSNQLDEEEIQAEVDTFLFAGHDTVSSAISFGLFEVAKHQDVQKKILEEIIDIVGPDKDTEITLNNLQEMKYVDCVMKEILRIYPPVALFERELEEDILLDGLKIPSGTTISFHPYMHHRNEKWFPDPERFDPDRFLPHNTATRHPFAFIPFSAGARNCIGSKYALMNSKTTILNVIRNFEVHPVVPAHKPLLGNDSVMKALNGLPIILKLRE